MKHEEALVSVIIGNPIEWMCYRWYGWRGPQSELSEFLLSGSILQYINPSLSAKPYGAVKLLPPKRRGRINMIMKPSEKEEEYFGRV